MILFLLKWSGSDGRNILCHRINFENWVLYFAKKVWENKIILGTRSEKNGIMWGKFPSGGPPPPNFHIFYRFLPFYKPLNWKKQRKIWSGFGSDPSPPFGNFPHLIPFFFLTTFLKEMYIWNTFQCFFELLLPCLRSATCSQPLLEPPSSQTCPDQYSRWNAECRLDKEFIVK